MVAEKAKDRARSTAHQGWGRGKELCKGKRGMCGRRKIVSLFGSRDLAGSALFSGSSSNLKVHSLCGQLTWAWMKATLRQGCCVWACMHTLGMPTDTLTSTLCLAFSVTVHPAQVWQTPTPTPLAWETLPHHSGLTRMSLCLEFSFNEESSPSLIIKNQILLVKKS